MRKIEKQFRAIRVLLINATCALVLVGAAVWAAPAGADDTRFWRQSDYDDFQRGTATGVALRSDGAIALAPKFAPVSDPNVAHLRTLRTDSRGNLYAAGGSNAKVIRVDGSGKQSTVFESSEMTAQALAVDKSDNVYVGTSPDGKIYKVTPNGQKSIFFEPKTKYIWDLTFGPDGTLYAATGDMGKIFSIMPDGKGDVFFASDETHIRALLLDGKGNLMAGTEPKGWVMRIPLAAGNAGRQTAANGDSGRRGYVLYETAKREITSMVLDPSGNLYVAAIGDKQRPTPGITLPVQQPAQQPAAAQGQSVTVTVGGALAAAPAGAAPFIPFPTSTSSAVYRIAPDGSPEEIWRSPDEIVYALSLSAEGKPLVGIGNRGAVIEVRDDRVFSRLTRTESEQVTGFARAANGAIYVATANPGKVFVLGPELASEGSIESQTYDARIFSRWGRLTWWGENAGGSSAAPQFYVRSGNTTDPANNWSAWSGPYNNGAVTDSPAARFVQWKAVLRDNSKPAPEISWVELAYLPKNVAPRINAIAVQNPGIRAQGGIGGGASATIQLRLPSSSGSPNTSGGGQRAQGEAARVDPPVQGSMQKGFQSALWNAADENGDDLIYAVYYRGENEKNWKLLREKVEQKFYSWDTNALPDGAYYLKIVASDVRSNTPEQALESARESERFVVDNTSPVVTDLAAEPGTTGGEPTVAVRFRATDNTSVIARAQYSLDAGDWIPVQPTGGLSDSLDERYTLTLRNVAPGEHTVSVRVHDRFENEAAAKVTFSVPARR